MKTRLNILYHWLARIISAGLRRTISRSTRPERTPHSLRGGQVI
jgi:hypothetical protein